MGELLAAYGIRLNVARVAANRGESAALAKSIGFPVVMKLRSPQVVHKSDVGGVRLNVRTEEEAAQTFGARQREIDQNGVGFHHPDQIERLPAIERSTGYDIATIKEAIEVVKHLNPRPGASFTAVTV